MASSKSYLESLPKKRMGAGCLFFDEHGCVMLVKPTYKPNWEIPGGVVELNESPKQCCQREVREEIGLERKIGDLLVVDYNSQTDNKTESLMFIFNGGTLTLSEIESVQIRGDELSEFRFFTIETLPKEMTGTLRNRVLAAWQQAKKGNGVYFENQEQI
ncbi:MAG: NUDIX hydrolase [Anaerolineales bacterium]|nr:NUDIX hydrolase [Anaerolineales bacterium]